MVKSRTRTTKVFDGHKPSEFDVVVVHWIDIEGKGATNEDADITGFKTVTIGWLLEAEGPEGLLILGTEYQVNADRWSEFAFIPAGCVTNIKRKCKGGI
jgi:hypothetical protein